MKKRLIFDIDSSVADFITPFLHWLYEQKIAPYVHTTNEVTHYDWMFFQYGNETSKFFLENPSHLYTNIVKPFPFAVEFVAWCQEHFKVSFLSSSADNNKIPKLEFCKRWFGISDVNFCDLGGDKYLYTADAILFDDYPLHCIKHTSINHSPSIIFNYQNNNGWSYLKDYHNYFDTFPPNNTIHQVQNYEEAKQILLYYI